MTSPASLFLTLANHDRRICFAFNGTKNSYIYVNPAFNAFFKLPQTLAKPELLLSLLHPDDADYVKATCCALQPGELKDNIQFRVILQDRKQYHLRLSILLEIDENNEHLLIGYMDDISAQKVNEEKEKELSEKKNAILNIISHDLAGPLGSIRNFAFLLSRKTKSLEDQQINNTISAIEHISKRSINMIQEFIKQEFIESAGVDLVKTRVDLVEKLENFMEEYYLAANETDKTFQFQSSHPQIYAEIDENKFMLVINNLISNSLKFTPDGGVISIHITEKDASVTVSVADTGVGIPQKFHATLFDKFPESRRTGLKGEPSVGLGMSIIKTIVEWHRGEIWFESEENKGSTFYIRLPAKVTDP